MRFNSLKVSDSFTASALIIPSRKLSWISRSSSCMVLGVCGATGRSFRFSTFLLCRFNACLPTVFPRDNDSENYVKSAEPCRQQPVGPGWRDKQRDRAQHHEANSH